MLIDWFTVAAQIINFLILVWLLKRYLYKPILDAIDKREKRIATQLKKAEDTKFEAKKERDTFREKNVEFEAQRKALLAKMSQEVNLEKQRLLVGARNEYETLRVKQSESFRNEQVNLSREIIRRTQSEVFAITRKTLKALASESLEERMVKVFSGRLRELSDDDKKGLAIAGPALVRSTFELPPPQRTEIETALEAIVDSEMTIHYETTPDLVSGIELTLGGNKMAWSISDYLTAMEKSLCEVVDDREEKVTPARCARQEREPHAD